MDRSMLINLLLQGMECPIPTRRLWTVTCLKITRRTRKMIEIDEYHGTTLSQECKMDLPDMICTGSSLLNLETGKVAHQPTKKQPAKRKTSG